MTLSKLNQSSFPHIQGKKGEIQGGGGPVVSVLVSGSSCLGSSPGQGHCIVFLDKALISHSASLHPGVCMGTEKLNAGVTLPIDQHPVHGGVEILLVTRATETRIRSGLMGDLVHMQTLLFNLIFFIQVERIDYSQGQLYSYVLINA